MIYTIHKLPDTDTDVPDTSAPGTSVPGTSVPDTSIIAIGERTTWLGLFLPALWLAIHRLWTPLLFYIALCLFVWSLSSTSYSSYASALLFFVHLYLFFEGCQLRRYSLERRGYIFTDVVEASSFDSAIHRAVHRIFHQHSL